MILFYRKDGKLRTVNEILGRDPKKSGNLIAVLCYFCEWLDFWRFVRFRVGVAGNGDVAPPGFTVELSCKICSCIVNRDMQ